MKLIPTDNKSLIIRAIAFMAVFGWLIFSAPTMFAQAEGGANTEETAEAGKEGGEESSEEVKMGEEGNEAAALAAAGELNLLESEDPAIWVLLVLFVVGVAVGLERMWVFMKTPSRNAELVRTLTEELSKNPGSIDELAAKVSDKRYGVEGRIAAVTLKGWDTDEETMQEYSHAATTAERRFLSARLPILSTLGNNAPFIGLLGTVLGIMKAFRDLANAADAGPQVVMKGISEALVATATGLAVAIPAVMLFNWFSSMIKTKMSNSEEIVSIMTAIRMATQKQGALKASKPTAQEQQPGDQQ